VVLGPRVNSMWRDALEADLCAVMGGDSGVSVAVKPGRTRELLFCIEVVSGTVRTLRDVIIRPLPLLSPWSSNMVRQELGVIAVCLADDGPDATPSRHHLRCAAFARLHLTMSGISRVSGRLRVLALQRGFDDEEIEQVLRTNPCQRVVVYCFINDLRIQEPMWNRLQELRPQRGGRQVFMASILGFKHLALDGFDVLNSFSRSVIDPLIISVPKIAFCTSEFRRFIAEFPPITLSFRALRVG